MTCPFLKETGIPVCTVKIHVLEVLSPDPYTLGSHCRSEDFQRCTRHPSSPVQEEITRVFG